MGLKQVRWEIQIKTITNSKIRIAAFSFLPLQIIRLSCIQAMCQNVSTTHFGAMEVRVVLEGSETLVGIPYDTTPGATLREKREYLMAAPVGDISKLFEADGHGPKPWILTHGPAHPAVVPSGFLVCNFVKQTTIGLRWSFSGDLEDTQRTRKILRGIIDCYPDSVTPATGHANVLDYLEGV